MHNINFVASGKFNPVALELLKASKDIILLENTKNLSLDSDVNAIHFRFKSLDKISDAELLYFYNGNYVIAVVKSEKELKQVNKLLINLLKSFK